VLRGRLQRAGLQDSGQSSTACWPMLYLQLRLDGSSVACLADNLSLLARRGTDVAPPGRAQPNSAADSVSLRPRVRPAKERRYFISGSSCPKA
jgi:hypothetical protein